MSGALGSRGSPRSVRLEDALLYSIDEVSDDKGGHLPFPRAASLMLSTRCCPHVGASCSHSQSRLFDVTSIILCTASGVEPTRALTVAS